MSRRAHAVPSLPLLAAAVLLVAPGRGAQSSGASGVSGERADELRPARIYAEIQVQEGQRLQYGLLVEYWQRVDEMHPGKTVRVYAKEGATAPTLVSVLDAAGLAEVVGTYLTDDEDLNARYHAVFRQTSAANLVGAGTVPGGADRPGSADTLRRTCRARPGEFRRARDLARRLVEHLNREYVELAARVYVRETGPYGAMELYVDYPTRWQWEVFDARLARDEAFVELERELLSTMIDDSVHDEWWTRVL